MKYYSKLVLPLLAISSLQSMALETENKRPNIILVYCDDLGYGDLGITGHPHIQTPHIDQMALSGIRFTNYYSASPASTASRYAMLTGRYPSRSGFGWVLDPKSTIGIHSEEQTVAELLKQQGYATAMYGKWHLGSTKREYLPLQNGFDEYIGLPYSNDMIPPLYQDIALLNGNDTLEINPDQSKLTKLYTEKALSFIKQNKKSPFFIYLPYAMPHVPLFPGKNFAGKSKRGAYGDVVEEIDWAMGQIFSTLEQEGIEKNTIVWFISDNGPWILKKEQGGSAGLFKDGKGSTWEGGVRVPCIAYWPGQISTKINEEVVTAMDVFATNVKLGGASIPGNRVTDGTDLRYYLGFTNVKEKPQTPYFYCGLQNEVMAVRLGKWKLHIKTFSQINKDYFSGELPLLFNLETDPSENYNLATQYPEIVRQLKTLINEHLEEIDRTGNDYGVQKSHRIKERL